MEGIIIGEHNADKNAPFKSAYTCIVKYKI